MKAFFVLFATLSVIQVIFIGESTTQMNIQGADYKDNIPSDYGQYSITASASSQDNGQFARRPSAADRISSITQNSQTRSEDPNNYNEQEVPKNNNNNNNNNGQNYYMSANISANL